MRLLAVHLKDILDPPIVEMHKIEERTEKHVIGGLNGLSRK